MSIEPRHVLLVMAGINVVLGLWAMITPAAMVGSIELVAATPSALAEVRAMYGGLELALGGLLFWHAMDEERVPMGLVIAAVTVGGLGSGRLLSLLISGTSPMAIFLTCIELGSSAVCAWFSRQ